VERLPSNSTDGAAAPGVAKRPSAWRPSNPGAARWGCGGFGAGKILEDHHLSKQRLLGGLKYVKMPVIMRCPQIILLWCKTYMFFRMSDDGFHSLTDIMGNYQQSCGMAHDHATNELHSEMLLDCITVQTLVRHIWQHLQGLMWVGLRSEMLLLEAVRMIWCTMREENYRTLTHNHVLFVWYNSRAVASVCSVWICLARKLYGNRLFKPNETQTIKLDDTSPTVLASNPSFNLFDHRFFGCQLQRFTRCPDGQA
jgi:hypothetical protein